MKKIFLLCLVVCSTLILSGCSFRADFVVINNSQDFIDVSYEINDSMPPKFANIEAFDNSNGTEWRELPQDRYKIDDQKRMVEVKLASNEALRIESVDAARIKTNPYSELSIQTLKITGKYGSVELKGNQVFENFEPKTLRWALFGPDTGAYVIYYK
ncbi:MAG TPA: hypothetical protein VF692_12880 [Pyrinomonadaceae bacterium]|jgi:hypothetical protein